MDHRHFAFHLGFAAEHCHLIVDIRKLMKIVENLLVTEHFDFVDVLHYDDGMPKLLQIHRRLP